MEQRSNYRGNHLRWAVVFLVLGILALIAPLNSIASPGASLDFNGAGNYVELGDTGDLWSNPAWLSQKTISLWIKPSSQPGPLAPVGSGQLILGTDKPRLFGITRSISNNQDRLWVWNSDSNGVDFVGVDFVPGEWLHLALTHNGTTLTVYANGLLAGTVASGPTYLLNTVRDGVVFLGGSGRTDLSQYFAGQIEEVRFWNAVVPQSTLQEWMFRELDPAHPNYSSLAAYYQMNYQPVGFLADDSDKNHPGTLAGGMTEANFIASTVPFPTPTPQQTQDSATTTPTLLPSATSTSVPSPTQTATGTPMPSTPTNLPSTPTATSTRTPTHTPLPATATPTNTYIPPTATNSPTATATQALPSPTPPPAGQLTEFAVFDTPGYSYDLFPYLQNMLVADLSGGLRIIDISSPASPVEIGFLLTPTRAYGVAAAGGIAYVAASNSGLRILDLQNPAHPLELGFYDTAGTAWDVTLYQELVYLSDRLGGVKIFDATNPANPILLHTIASLDQALDTTVTANVLYLADYSAGVRLFDVTAPASPQEISWTNGLGPSYGVHVAGDRLYVADGTMGLVILDISNPQQPLKLGQYRTGGTVRSTWVEGTTAYLADWTNGLYALDVSDPAQIELIDLVVVPGHARDVRYHNGLIFLAAYEGGLRIYSAP